MNSLMQWPNYFIGVIISLIILIYIIKKTFDFGVSAGKSQALHDIVRAIYIDANISEIKKKEYEVQMSHAFLSYQEEQEAKKILHKLIEEAYLSGYSECGIKMIQDRFGEE